VALARRKGRFFEMVILAVKTVKRTRMVEDRQIFVSVFRTFQIGITGIPTARARRANKISHTIGWNGIMVIRKPSFMGPPSPQPAVSDMPKSTKTCSAFCHLASVHTNRTRDASWIMGRFHRKAISPAAPGMNVGDLRPDFRKMATDAICAESNDI